MIFCPAESTQGYHRAHCRAAKFYARGAGQVPEMELMGPAGYEVNQESF